MLRKHSESVCSQGHILQLRAGHVGLQADEEVVLGHLQHQEGECQERSAEEITDLGLSYF